MRRITISLLVIALGVQGCGSPTENPTPDPSEDAAADPIEADPIDDDTAAAEPDDAQIGTLREEAGGSPGSDVVPCGPAPFVGNCGTIAPPPPLDQQPVAADTTPQ